MITSSGRSVPAWAPRARASNAKTPAVKGGLPRISAAALAGIPVSDPIRKYAEEAEKFDAELRAVRERPLPTASVPLEIPGLLEPTSVTLPADQAARQLSAMAARTMTGVKSVAEIDAEMRALEDQDRAERLAAIPLPENRYANLQAQLPPEIAAPEAQPLPGRQQSQLNPTAAVGALLMSLLAPGAAGASATSGMLQGAQAGADQQYADAMTAWQASTEEKRRTYEDRLRERAGRLATIMAGLEAGTKYDDARFSRAVGDATLASQTRIGKLRSEALGTAARTTRDANNLGVLSDQAAQAHRDYSDKQAADTQAIYDTSRVSLETSRALADAFARTESEKRQNKELALREQGRLDDQAWRSQQITLDRQREARLAKQGIGGGGVSYDAGNLLSALNSGDSTAMAEWKAASTDLKDYMKQFINPNTGKYRPGMENDAGYKQRVAAEKTARDYYMAQRTSGRALRGGILQTIMRGANIPHVK